MTSDIVIILWVSGGMPLKVFDSERTLMKWIDTLSGSEGVTVTPREQLFHWDVTIYNQIRKEQYTLHASEHEFVTHKDV